MPDFLKDFRVVISISIVFVITIIVNYVASRLIKKFIENKLAQQNTDVTGYKFLQHFATTIIFVIGIGIALSTIPGLESIGHSLLASAGVFSLVIGVASQQSIGNIVSGVFIVIYKPFRINDKIQINDKIGRVEDINMRHVILRDLENNRIIIPNSIINNEIIVNSNLSDERTCRKIEVGISYDSDVDLAIQLIQTEIAKHPLFVDVRTEDDVKKNLPLVKVKIVALADSSVTLRAWAWANSHEEGFELYCDSLMSIKKAFARYNIEIPFPQRVVSIKK